MYAASEESTSTVPERAVTDAGTTGHQDTAADELLPDSEFAAAAESGSNNDELCAVAQAVHETDVTNVSSEASNSSQGMSCYDVLVIL